MVDKASGSGEAGALSLDETVSELLTELKEDAENIVELMLTWDEDNSGTLDRREFRTALPVLGLQVSKEAADTVFYRLLKEVNELLVAEGRPLPEAPNHIDHWALFRLLVGDREDVPDVLAAEAAARERIEANATMRTMGESTFWTRDDGQGHAKNRHALRKRKSPLRSWSSPVATSWSDSLRTGGEGEEEEEVARFMQGTKLDAKGDVQAQLRDALSKNMTRVTELFRAWDDNSDGRVSRKEFCRGVRLFGLGCAMEEIEALYDTFDPNGDGSIEFSELNSLLRKTAPAEEPKLPPKLSLVKGGKWSKTSAKIMLGSDLHSKKKEHERLREALVRHSSSVISMFRQWDNDHDGRVSRKEFTAHIPNLDLGEPFSSDAIDRLFSELDADHTGTLDYRELENELKRAHRAEGEEELRSRAAKLLSRTDVIVVLGEPTRSKRTLCSRLAYTFGGTWLSLEQLLERELGAYGSKVAADIRRGREADPPRAMPTSIVKHCLRAAIHGRRNNGALSPLRGPFFLYDLPRSMSELRALEKAFGASPVALEFKQADFDTDGGAAPSAANIEATNLTFMTASEQPPPPLPPAVSAATEAAEAAAAAETAEAATQPAAVADAGPADLERVGNAERRAHAEGGGPRASEDEIAPFIFGGGGALSAVVEAVGGGHAHEIVLQEAMALGVPLSASASAIDAGAGAPESGREARRLMVELYSERKCLFTLDSEFETKTLLERIIRHLAVLKQKRLLEQREQTRLRLESERAVLLRQREYLEAASTYMASSLRQYGAQRIKLACAQAEAARQIYAEPSRLSQLRYISEVYAEKQMFGHATDALLGAEMPWVAKPPSPRAATAPPVPPAVDAPHPALVSPRTAAPAQHTGSSKHVSFGHEPRVDLQMSPRIWQTGTNPLPPVQIPSTLPAMRRIYERAVWPQVPQPQTRSSSPRTPRRSPRQLPPMGM